MPNIEVTKRQGRDHYYTRVDGRYVSTRQTDYRLAMKVAAQIHRAGVDEHRLSSRTMNAGLRDLIEDHLRHLETHDGRDPTHIRKKRMQLLAPVEAGRFRRLKDIRRKPLEEWLDSLSCGPKTRNEYLTAWNVFLDWLVYEDLLADNPIRGRVRRARVKRIDQKKRRALTPEEIDALLAVAGKHELLYMTALTTGSRFNELRQLKWADVHERSDDPYVVLRAETTKNRKGRTQSVTQELAEELVQARARAKTDRVFLSMPSHHTIDKHLKLAGIEKRTEEGAACFHSLRHSFTTIIARETGDARLAQRMADHSDITTTQRYLHTEQAEHAAVMRRFPVLRATPRATTVVQTGLSQSEAGSTRPSSNETQVPPAKAFSPDESECVVRGLVMEPGGIEPPCARGFSREPREFRKARSAGRSALRTGRDAGRRARQGGGPRRHWFARVPERRPRRD